MRAPSDQREGGTPGPANGQSPAPSASIVRSRLFIKYLALFVAVVSLALIANGVFDVFFSYKEQKASLVRIQREQAEAAAGKIGQFISEIESQVGWTTQLPWSAGTLEQRRFDALRLLRQVPAITELAEIDSSGHEQLRVSRLAMEVVGSGNDVSKEPAFTEAVAHKVYYGPVYFRRESEPYMTLSLAGTRRDTGVSIAQVNLKLIWDVLSKIKFSGHGRAFVVDAAGRLIAHPDISLVLRNTDMSQLAQVRSARAAVVGDAAEPVQEATDIEGHKVLTASAAVAPLGWHVFVETPIEEAYAPLYAAIERTALVLLAALALAFAAGMFLARRMVVPIQALRAGAARLGSGDLGQRIAIKSGDEVEALADQFNDMAGRLQESYANLEHKVEVRTRELSESLEQQTATSEVLRVISSSPGDLQPVFETMLENATRLCEAPFGTLLLRDGEVLRIAAGHVPPPSSALFEPGSELVVADNPGHPLVRVLSTKDIYHISDLRTEPSYIAGNPRVVAFVETVGARTALCVPMMKDDECVGAFVTCRQEVRPFTDKQIALVENFAAQAVIAIENTRLLTELRQSLEQQTATADVLRVISSSPNDLTPVFDAMLANAARLCEAQFGNLLLCEEGAFRVGAQHRIPAAFAEHFQRGTVFHPGPLAPVSRAAATADFVHIVDLTVDAAYQAGDPPVVAVADLGGARSMLVVPMLKEGSAIGALSIFRQEVRPFSDKQIELVKNFAAQAVIAIENARLLTELRQSLEQQTATSEVLGVISRSKFELQPILQSVVDTAARLCHADAAVIFRLEQDGLYRFAAGYSLEPAYIEIERRTPIAPGSGTIVGRAAMSRQVARIDDAWTDPLYEKKEQAKIGPGARSMMGVPLMRDGEAIGVIGLARSRIEPFAERDVDLVTTFADQAVIAIENVRLFEAEQQRRRELTESLEQQTATSEVLRVISGSPGDLQPVFAAMLEKAVSICDAAFGNIYRWDDDALNLAATHNTPPAFAEARRYSPHKLPGPQTVTGRMLATKTVIHVVDATAQPGYADKSDPAAVAAVELGGARTILAVPMLKENELIGSFTVYRQEVRPFTDKQIALVTSFASQAVIAIENARLLGELRQRTDELGRSVGELRALGEVSQAVNSTLELETVLSTIVTKAVQLSNTEAGAIYVLDERDREFHLRATYGMDRDLIEALSQRHIGFDESNVTLALANREPIQVADLRDDQPSELNDLILRAGYRARLMAPLFRGADIVGLLVVRRRTPGAFPQNTVDLIKTFAAQSVLAIQNARLFHEIDEKSRELEVAGQHKSQFLANMSHELRTPLNAIIGYSEILQEEAADAGQNEIVPDLKKIEGAGRHLLGLINDILDLSKVEAGRMEVFLEDVELVPLLEEVRALIMPLAEKNGNVLDLKLAGDIGTIHTDRTKLKQSLLNVLSNGSKFTENGRLTLVAERFADNAGRPMVRFAISDTGIGMTEEQLGRLFQAFSQADASTTKKYGGTGLGLAISRQFCQLLGGDIAVTSRPGEGSTFTIMLPTRSDGPAQVKPADAPRIAAEVNGVATVLIVDDDPAARELLTASLKGTGYRLVHASGGTEALALARTMRPDAITLDVMMPKPDGWDVLTALKADADLYDIPVIIVTMAPDRGIGLSLGAVDVLTKPVDRARLTALIHRLVRRDGPVLVVEDDADTREMMRHTIAKMGLAVAEAANGRRALGWLGEHAPPAMILLDLMMPEMDGFEFLDALSARSEWHDIPIVVVTAKQLNAAERERLLLQARKVIEKAKATRVDIAAAIAAAVRRRSGRAAVVANADK
jgi:GAF domain-containing protein/CheY-like chemotaxis protein/HAMP domain-containing protein